MQFEHQVGPGVAPGVVLAPYLSPAPEGVVASIVPSHVNISFSSNCVQNLKMLRIIVKLRVLSHVLVLVNSSTSLRKVKRGP